MSTLQRTRSLPSLRHLAVDSPLVPPNGLLVEEEDAACPGGVGKCNA